MGFALKASSGETYYFVHCYLCGIAFGLPDNYRDERLNDHATFYCPSGHVQCYAGKSEAERLKEQLETERNRRQWAEDDKRATERRLYATKGKVTLLKRRMARGACPCCKQKFADLKQHMEQTHPGYGE